MSDVIKTLFSFQSRLLIYGSLPIRNTDNVKNFCFFYYFSHDFTRVLTVEDNFCCRCRRLLILNQGEGGI